MLRLHQLQATSGDYIFFFFLSECAEKIKKSFITWVYLFSFPEHEMSPLYEQRSCPLFYALPVYPQYFKSPTVYALESVTSAFQLIQKEPLLDQ